MRAILQLTLCQRDIICKFLEEKNKIRKKKQQNIHTSHMYGICYLNKNQICLIFRWWRGFSILVIATIGYQIVYHTWKSWNKKQIQLSDPFCARTTERILWRHSSFFLLIFFMKWKSLKKNIIIFVFHNTYSVHHVEWYFTGWTLNITMGNVKEC